jgi:hypothetical protein
VYQLNPALYGGISLLYSSYLSGTTGNDTATGIAVDANQNMYMVGTALSSDFPVSVTAYQSALWGDSDVFIAEMNPGKSLTVSSKYWPPKLQRVVSHDLGKVVLNLVVAVRLKQVKGARSEIKLVEDNGRDTLGLGISRNDARWAYGESLRRQARADSALLLAQAVEVAHVADPEFVDQCRAKGFGDAEVHQPGLAIRERVGI